MLLLRLTVHVSQDFHLLAASLMAVTLNHALVINMEWFWDLYWVWHFCIIGLGVQAAIWFTSIGYERRIQKLKAEIKRLKNQ